MLRVAVLCSHRAPGVLQMLRDPRHGSLFQVVACISSEHDLIEREALTQANVPTFVHDIRGYYAGWNAKLSDMELRKGFDATLVRRLAVYNPDIVILCSYLYIVSSVFLDAYPNRVVNVHHSDLPKYPGLHAVRDAIFAGERETRATAHLVTSELDAGPAIVRSWSFPVHPMVDDLRHWDAQKVLRAYAFAHQEWMIESAWAPLMLAAVEIFAQGDLHATPMELEPSGRSLRALRALR